MKKKLRYWFKTYVYEGIDIWVMYCEHIGQAKLFGYILCTYNRTTGEWSNTAERRKAVEQLLELTPKTMYNYLNGLVRVKLLIRQGRGTYKVNEDYVSYGDKRSTDKQLQA